MNRLLLDATLAHGIGVASIDSGGLRNAIPREGFAIITVGEADVAALKTFLEEQAAVLKVEYNTTDPNLASVTRTC